MLLEGLFLPVITPFYLDGRLNLRKLEHNIDRYGKTPAAGFAVLSEQGDPTLLTDQETREALQSAMETAPAEKVMLAGISRDSVVATLELAEFAASLAYDAVLVGVPSIFGRGHSARPKERLAYFLSVADRSVLPLVLVSSAAGELTPEDVIELAGHANIIGLVDGSGDAKRVETIRAATASARREATVTGVFAAVTGRMLRQRDTTAGQTFISASRLTDGATALAVAPPAPAIRTRTKPIGFQVLGGRTRAMLTDLKAGAVGAMPAFADCAPQACYEVLAAWKDGDEGLAAEKQARVQAAAVRIEEELGGAGIRYGCDLNGYFGGRPRLPLLPVTGEQRIEIEGLMRAIRN